MKVFITEKFLKGVCSICGTTVSALQNGQLKEIWVRKNWWNSVKMRMHYQCRRNRIDQSFLNQLRIWKWSACTAWAMTMWILLPQRPWKCPSGTRPEYWVMLRPTLLLLMLAVSRKAFICIKRFRRPGVFLNRQRTWVLISVERPGIFGLYRVRAR